MLTNKSDLDAAVDWLVANGYTTRCGKYEYAVSYEYRGADLYCSEGRNWHISAYVPFGEFGDGVPTLLAPWLAEEVVPAPLRARVNFLREQAKLESQTVAECLRRGLDPVEVLGSEET